MNLQINPRAYLKSDVADTFSRVADGVRWMNETRRQMHDCGYGNHETDYDSQIDAMEMDLSQIDYPQKFYDLAMNVVEEMTDMLILDEDFNAAYKNFSWNDMDTMKAIIHQAQDVIERYFEINPRFVDFRRNIFLRFREQNINEKGVSFGSHYFRAGVSSLNENGCERIYTSHEISINIHESAVSLKSGPNGVLSTLIHENMHALEDMFRCYFENMHVVDSDDDEVFECLLASRIFYPNAETRAYAYMLYWEHVSERFCRTMQVFFESCLEKTHPNNHMLSHPETLEALECLQKVTHHPSLGR